MQQIKTGILTSFLCAAVLSATSRAAEQSVHYEEAAADVSFAAVLELDSGEADARLVYGAQQPALQYGLLWLPKSASSAAKAPLVVVIHGGCWLNEYSISHTNAFSTALAQVGYAVWSLEYRRTGDEGGGWPGSFDDILAGIRYTDKLQNYPVDLNRIVIAGHSAGGHLALLAGTQLPNLRAVLGVAAISDLVEYSLGTNSCQTAAVDFMGTDFRTNPELFKIADPAQQALHKNTLLLHGDKDAIVPISQSQSQSLERGAQLVVSAGAGDFDWIHPGTAAFRQLLATLSAQIQP